MINCKVVKLKVVQRTSAGGLRYDSNENLDEFTSRVMKISNKISKNCKIINVQFLHNNDKLVAIIIYKNKRKKEKENG